jgi:hypothetical protein
MLVAALATTAALSPTTWVAASVPSQRPSSAVARVTMTTPPSDTLARTPANAGELWHLTQELLALEASPLTLAQLTDAIDYPRADGLDGASVGSFALFLKRQRRSQLLTDLLRSDRKAYLETVSFLNIPRRELPNRQDVPLRECDPNPRRPSRRTAILDDDEELIADCVLEDEAMGENPLEGALLEVTRNIYAGETGVSRTQEGGIGGLIDEMRRFMLSAEGSSPDAQRLVLVRTLRTLMTPYLPPFYRIFMGGIVPKHDPSDTRVGADPKWLADAVKWLRAKLPAGKDYLVPGKQLGPWFYAPTLTAVVAPFAFGFLVGPSTLNRRSDGALGGLVVEKCKFLQDSGCKGMCLNSCKVPAQQLFSELGLPLRVSPNFETQECQWSFGEVAPDPADDPTWPQGCIIGCTSREAMKELNGGSSVTAACE